MKTSKPHWLGSALLLAMFLMASGLFAHKYQYIRMENIQNQENADPGSYWLSSRLVEMPIFSFLPRWCLNRWGVPISREGNSALLKNVLEVFDPSLRPFLTSVPIILDSSASTARAYPAKGYIGVSPDWDNPVMKSKYQATYEQRGMKPEEPVFIHRFKTNLLIHEYLHILQAHQGIDRRSCYEAIKKWYLDPEYGRPNSDGIFRPDTTNASRPVTSATNRMKYVLWHQLYNYQGLRDVPRDESWQNMHYVERYRRAEPGVEEFAYIGEEILASGSGSANYRKTGQWSDNDWQEKKMRLPELSPAIITLFQGVFTPALTQ